MNLFSRLWIAAFAAAVMAVAAPLQSAADAPASYRQAVADALAIVQGATSGDATAAQQAAAVLEAGTGKTQPEILADLNERPPNFQDAAARLNALLEALDSPATTTDPAQARRSLHEVLSMHRYDGLHQLPSAFDRFVQWLTDRIRQFLDLVLGGLGASGPVPSWVIYAASVLIMAAVGIVVFRATRGHLAGGLAAGEPEGPRSPDDYFALADRLAGQGDRVGAIRALCAGVAGTLAGERSWEGSPLTVREIFRRAQDPAALDALLAPFEAAVYGRRSVDAAAYDRAARIAALFRAPAEKAA